MWNSTFNNTQTYITETVCFDLTPMVVIAFLLFLLWKWNSQTQFQPGQLVKLKFRPIEPNEDEIRSACRSISTYGKEDYPPQDGTYTISNYFYDTPNCKGQGVESSVENQENPRFKNAFLTPTNLKNYQECFWFITIPENQEFCDGTEVSINQFEDGGIIGHGTLCVV